MQESEFKKGDNVRARFEQTGGWYEGVIEHEELSGNYLVRWKPPRDPYANHIVLPRASSVEPESIRPHKA